MNAIQPITTFKYNTFKGNSVAMSDYIIPKKKNRKLAAIVGSIVALGVSTTAVGILSKQSRMKALEKAGLQLVDGLIYKKGTKQRFTGLVKRNVSAFGFKKEVNSVVDGQLMEVLNYGFKGKELDGYFYKNGKILYRSAAPNGNSKIKYYSLRKYDDNGAVTLISDCKAKPKESVFAAIRELVKKETP